MVCDLGAMVNMIGDLGARISIVATKQTWCQGQYNCKRPWCQDQCSCRKPW